MHVCDQINPHVRELKYGLWFKSNANLGELYFALIRGVAEAAER